MGDASDPRPAPELDPARAAQATALPAGDHIGVRALVRSLRAEHAKSRGDDGRTRRARRLHDRASLGGEDAAGALLQ